MMGVMLRIGFDNNIECAFSDTTINDLLNLIAIAILFPVDMVGRVQARVGVAVKVDKTIGQSQ